MVKLDKFEIEFNNSEHAYFAGQEISGRVVIELSEPKKVNEILLELKGRARTYWTKHSGKSRSHCSHSEPYFCEQFNTNYTQKFAVSSEKEDKKKKGVKQERVLPEGRHEVPFSYTLPKTLPSSFEGDYGYIRYTCRATCERPWDFDIVTKKAFTVIGIEDINEDPKACQPASASDSNSSIKFCCRKNGNVITELAVERTGYTPGEVVRIKGKITNQSSRTLKNSTLRLRQHVCYKAKTFAGTEHVKNASKVVYSKTLGEVAAHQSLSLDHETISVPALPPRLSSCHIIDVRYTIDAQADGSNVVSVPLIVGTIPLLADLVMFKGRPKAANGQTNGTDLDQGAQIQVTITDESGQTTVSDEHHDELSAEVEAAALSKKRVRMPSSILSELYPTLPSPYYKESHFGPVDISDEREQTHYGDTKIVNEGEFILYPTPAYALFNRILNGFLYCNLVVGLLILYISIFRVRFRRVE
ncbi:hypothetical protein QR680_011569 [Steinernema hermaphroditum]|uniref:Arrestin C-terminal-like domain-containing protein n=1 Tax=Steinernema hermaphroditum TaxID=289476 RepID=A0AA39I0G9_9BILA|nr:hypothetical protein QR680_011569 [Steinernema hermaphroditum]